MFLELRQGVIQELGSEGGDWWWFGVATGVKTSVTPRASSTRYSLGGAYI